MVLPSNPAPAATLGEAGLQLSLDNKQAAGAVDREFAYMQSPAEKIEKSDFLISQICKILNLLTCILNYLECFLDSLNPPGQILAKSERFSSILTPFRQLFRKMSGTCRENIRESVGKKSGNVGKPV